MLGVDCARSERDMVGGLVVLWKGNIHIECLSWSTNHITFQVRDDGEDEDFRATVIYGFP